MFQLSAESSIILTRPARSIALRPTAADPAARNSAVRPVRPLRGQGRAPSAGAPSRSNFSRPRSSPRPLCTCRPSRSRSLRPSSHQRTIPHIHCTPSLGMAHPLAYAYSSSDSTPSPDLPILVRGPRALLFPCPPALALAHSGHSASHDLDHQDEVDVPPDEEKVVEDEEEHHDGLWAYGGNLGDVITRWREHTQRVGEEVVLRLNAGVVVAVFFSQGAAAFPSQVVAASLPAKRPFAARRGAFFP
ncbi:hypothetical protein C8J57DRAFT_1237461 [Mycena rebaudengoi]|nr:hypothetical protein C8J57DRAFT_1237461 [Mycena rebaudengoi]